MEMLYNSDIFRFLRFTKQPDSLTQACIESLQLRKQANSGSTMNSSAEPLELAFNEMRRFTQSCTIRQVCSHRKFDILITSSLHCTSSQCGHVEETIPETHVGLTIEDTVGGSGFPSIQEALDSRLSRAKDQFLCPKCDDPFVEVRNTNINLPNTLLLYINIRKIRCSERLTIQLPSSTETYQLSCGLTTQHLPNNSRYSAFWQASANLYWHMGCDEEFADNNLDGGYALKKTAEELPPYPTILVYTLNQYVGTPLPPYQAPYQAPVATGPVHMGTLGESRRGKPKKVEVAKNSRMKKTEVGKNTEKAREAVKSGDIGKAAEKIWLKKPPKRITRKSGRLQGKSAGEENKDEE